MKLLMPKRAKYINTNKVRNIREGVSPDNTDLGGSGEGDIPWGKGGDRSELHKRYPGGKMTSPSQSTEVKKEMPAEGDRTRGITNRTQLEASYKKANDFSVVDRANELLMMTYRNPEAIGVLKDFLLENGLLDTELKVELFDLSMSSDDNSDKIQFMNDLFNNVGKIQASMKKSAMHLYIDNNLRGSVNYVVESEPHLSWKDIKSINYTTVPKDVINLNEFPKSLREDNIIIYHANTPELKVQGLQNVDHEDFPDNAVMVFYKTAGAGFHMNNVKFPLDIIFTDDKFNVLGTKSMYPNTTELCFPPYGAVHAVEAKLGFVKANNIKKGDKIKIN